MSGRIDGPLLSVVPVSQLARVAAEFVVSRRAGGCSPRTIEYYRNELRFLCAYLESQGIQDVKSITPTHLRGFLLDTGERRNAGGVHCAFRVVKTFLRWFEAEYEPTGWQNPIHKVSAPKLEQKALPPVSMADLRAMLATCDKSFTGARDRAIMLMLLDTGLRASELLALTTGDVSADGAVRVRHGKGGKSRVVFIGSKTQQALARYMRFRGDRGAGDPLWLGERGAPLHIGGLKSLVRRRAKLAGVPRPALHGFRRAFALLSLRAGMDVYSLQRLMGHSDLSVLRRYLAQTEDDLRDAHERAGVVDRLM